MVFPQVIAAFQAVFNIIALPGNLLVIATVILESSRWFYVKRYILLASLALSDRLILILVFNSHSASELQRKKPWLLTHVTQVTSLDWVIVFYYRMLNVVRYSHGNKHSMLTVRAAHPFPSGSKEYKEEIRLSWNTLSQWRQKRRLTL